MVAKRLVFGCGIGLVAEDPFVVVANDVSGAGVVEGLVFWCEDFRFGPGDEVIAFGDGSVNITAAVGFAVYLCVKDAKDAVMIVSGGISVGDLSGAVLEDWTGDFLEVYFHFMGRWCKRGEV